MVNDDGDVSSCKSFRHVMPKIFCMGVKQKDHVNRLNKNSTSLRRFFLNAQNLCKVAYACRFVTILKF